jgi:4-hydroxy-tetrahydrodipicolinate synthase
MKALEAKEIFGNWATLLTPINSDETINYDLLKDEIDILITSEVNGIYSNGTAGEFYNQTENEFDKINQILSEKCSKTNTPFQIGVSHMSPIISLERLKRSIQLKPSAIQVILPDWFPVTDEEMISFLEKISETAGRIGIVLYNPPHAKRKLTPKEFGNLAKKIPNLVGVKVPWTNKEQFKKMNKYCSKLSVFIPGHFLATGYSQGATGAYSNVACINPKVAQFWYNMMSTDINKALELEKRIQQFMTNYIVPYIVEEKYSNQAVDKFMAAIGNWSSISPKLRWPYRWISGSEIDKIREHAKKLLPEFF